MQSRLLLALALAAGLALLPVTAGAAAADDASQAERAAVGRQAPAIALPDAQGAIHRSADLIDKKHLIAVFFRGAW